MFSVKIHRMGLISGWSGLLALSMALPAFGQETQASLGIPEPPEAMASRLPAELGTLRPGKSRLLREGSMLVDVQGSMNYDESRKVWIFNIRDVSESSFGHALTLLPCSVLQEMIELHAIAELAQVEFEVTGLVLVYRGRSYLLPSTAPQIFHLPRAETTVDEMRDEVTSEAIKDEEDDSIDSILNELQEAVGPIARSASSSSTLRPMDNTVLVLEGTMIVGRRGHLTRTASGAWLFVFDSDASGLGDPPMTILPCLLLERMEQHTRHRGGVASMKISGRVFAFHGQNYLHPTVFQIPRERTRLTP